MAMSDSPIFRQFAKLFTIRGRQVLVHRDIDCDDEVIIFKVWTSVGPLEGKLTLGLGGDQEPSDAAYEQLAAASRGMINDMDEEKADKAMSEMGMWGLIESLAQEGEEDE